MNKTILEISQGESIGGMGTVTSICGFTDDGERIILWTHAHHIEGPLSIDTLSAAVSRILRKYYNG